MKIWLSSVLFFASLNGMAAEECDRVRHAVFETRTGIELASGSVYLVEGTAAAAAIAFAQTNDAAICVYGIAGDRATGVRLAR